MMYHLNLSPIN